MTARKWTLALLALWAFCIGASVAVLWLTPARGDGLTRGINIVMTFLAWQAAAGLVAIAVWITGRRVAATWLRWLARLPLLLAILLVLSLAGLLLWVNLGDPGRPETPPASAPAVPTQRPPVPAEE